MTELIDWAVRWGVALVCLLVLGGCIDRVRLMSWATHRVAVYGIYLCAGAFAGGVLTSLVLGRTISWYAAAGVAGYVLHLVQTWRDWGRGAPEDSERAPLGER